MRFEIEDRKGLEIVMLTALLSFQDSSDLFHAPSGSATPLSQPTISRRKATGDPPQLPKKPAPRTGVERIAEMQKEVNEVEVGEEGDVGDYAQYCAKLLEVISMQLFITALLKYLFLHRTMQCYSSQFKLFKPRLFQRFFK